MLTEQGRKGEYPVNILFVVFARNETIGGAKRALSMAPYLGKYCNVTIAINDVQANRHRINKIKNIKGEFINDENVYNYQKDIKKIYRKVKPDIVYTNYLSIKTLFSFRDSVRIIEHAELYSRDTSLSIVERLKHTIYEWLSLLIADALLLASKKLKREYEKRKKRIGSAVKMKYLPYGYTRKKEPNKYTEDILSKKDKKKIVYFGSIKRKCGFKDVIDAIVKLNKKGRSVGLEFCGSGKREEELKKYVAKKNASKNISFNGFIKSENVGDYLSNADALLCPLEYNDRDQYRFPSKIPMYLATGNPIVTCRLQEVVSCLGEKGFYYDPNDITSLYQAIASAIDGKSVSYSDKTMSTYSWESISNEFKEWAHNLVEYKQKRYL